MTKFVEFGVTIWPASNDINILYNELINSSSLNDNIHVINASISSADISKNGDIKIRKESISLKICFDKSSSDSDWLILTIDWHNIFVVS